ncbi:MAG: hypothetical protein JWL66_2220 [Sphingomonadales bacterium]|jgi:hypothetical protein|nr:hypothetical protein [Sphingomonadales bacterium]
MKIYRLATLAALAIASPALAQTPPSAAVAQANNAAAAQSDHQTKMNANEQARYAEDRAAYLTALRSHNREAAMDAHIYDRQQRAYADAMYAWRVQVEDCRRGIRAACNAPTPDPANFW